jgi:hypothetical protein
MIVMITGIDKVSEMQAGNKEDNSLDTVKHRAAMMIEERKEETRKGSSTA